MEKILAWDFIIIGIENQRKWCKSTKNRQKNFSSTIFCNTHLSKKMTANAFYRPWRNLHIRFIPNRTRISERKRSRIEEVFHTSWQNHSHIRAFTQTFGSFSHIGAYSVDGRFLRNLHLQFQYPAFSYFLSFSFVLPCCDFQASFSYDDTWMLNRCWPPCFPSRDARAFPGILLFLLSLLKTTLWKFLSPLVQKNRCLLPLPLKVRRFRTTLQ